MKLWTFISFWLWHRWRRKTPCMFSCETVIATLPETARPRTIPVLFFREKPHTKEVLAPATMLSNR